MTTKPQCSLKSKTSVLDLSASTSFFAMLAMCSISILNGYSRILVLLFRNNSLYFPLPIIPYNFRNNFLKPGQL